MQTRVVTKGNLVHVIIDGHPAQLMLVEPQNIDPGTGRISFGSPLGQALQGMAKGESVDVQLPSGRTVHVIVAAIEN